MKRDDTKLRRMACDADAEGLKKERLVHSL